MKAPLASAHFRVPRTLVFPTIPLVMRQLTKGIRANQGPAQITKNNNSPNRGCRGKPCIWVWLKIKQDGLRRCWSMFPLTKVLFWYRFFEPQPYFLRDRPAALPLNWRGSLGLCQGAGSSQPRVCDKALPHPGRWPKGPEA